MSIKDLLRSEESITWGQIKAQLYYFTEDQLSQNVVFWGDCKGGKFSALQVLTEDHINPSGEGCEPVSLYANDPEYIEGEPITFAKGSVILELIED
ncbi:hypothetical protein [Chryseobacterium vrystaatense]|uniref:Uncharacterized protein n=1 Tax=Chryseobacterium vrystaatense TaxID=307480 RepID=A0A1M4ZHJ1_9FLAO|nr:hypothetical protein [Chryseobacterium vrystaatense]SHF17272.1 hypothetical protein SAMN02787073_1594 [Chryseobacterium vrystaatense]